MKMIFSNIKKQIPITKTNNINTPKESIKTNENAKVFSTRMLNKVYVSNINCESCGK